MIAPENFPGNIWFTTYGKVTGVESGSNEMPTNHRMTILKVERSTEDLMLEKKFRYMSDMSSEAGQQRYTCSFLPAHESYA